ncbi:hypothetical protein C7455_1204 [Roseicyclus mahoneyensis]|uniref:Uncharacterized protein n=2 Tax=Roseicyclus mahoneyensis TaxID=164332 RepID=A0A316G2S2_9RHOB|nr:hypothetical protein C7455_1204 [Roseicyclus mahoneyensis]
MPQRSVISDMFRYCAKQYGTARPLEDAWTSVFPHIAWPVRNAMVPREIHGSLARLVREFLGQTRGIGVTRATLPSLRELARGFGSRRLESWLQDDDLALSVIGYLVSGRIGELSMERGFMQRLGNDLRSEGEVRRLERIIRARRIAMHHGLGSLPKARYELLLDDAEARGLGVRGPKLAPAEIEAVRSELDVPLSNLTVNVGARSTTLESFLGGDILFIGRPSCEVPRPRLIELDIPEWLEAAIVPAPGLLFRDEGDDGYQTQLLPSDRVTSGISFYELVLDGLTPDEWGDGLYHFVSGTPDGDKVLARHGLHVEAEPIVEFRGGLTLHHDGTTVGQASGRPIQALPRIPFMIVAERLDGAETIEFSLSEKRWNALPMTEGIWTLSSAGMSKIPPIDLVFRELEPPEPVTLSLQPESIGLSEIARGAGALHLSSPIALHDVDIHCTLESSNGQSRSVSIRAMTAPARLGFDRPEFLEMRAAARLWSGGGMHARLRVHVAGLDDRSWTLTSPEPEWLYQKSSGQWIGKGQEPKGSLVCDPLKSCTSFLQRDSEPENPLAAYRLLCPNASGDSSLRNCILEEPTAGMSLAGLPRAMSDQILRLSETGAGGCSLTKGLESYFCWSLATAETAIGEALRANASRQVEDRLVAAFCGDLWLKTEKACRGLGTSFHQRLVAEAVKEGLVCDTTAFSPLTEDEKRDLVAFLEDGFRRVLPKPDLIVVPDGEMWPELDDAVLDAWEKLSEKSVSAGGSELEFDAGNADGLWQKLVVRAREAARLPELTALILPSLRARSLERVPYETSHLDDLIAALVSSHSDVQSRSGRWITPADLRALLQMFLAPERVMDDPEWRGRLLRFGADRFTARAVRYTALRYRATTSVGLQ